MNAPSNMTLPSLDTSEVAHYLHQKKPLWNAIALFYTFSGYVGGLALLLAHNGWLNGVGVIWLTHSLVIAAYLSHELMHGTIFEERRWNVFFGNLMLWLTGACYARFDDLARMHIAHHVNRVDFCRFDLAAFLKGLPTPLRAVLMGLEWLYIPSLAYLLRVRSMTAPFWLESRRGERLANVGVFLVRTSLFIGLGLLSLKALMLYWVAFTLMITLLRFMDSFQHTYEVFPVGAALPKRDRAHEQANTFSNIVSYRHGWLNLLMLNFGYHNAHHELMKCPWHSLPELDRNLFTGQEPHYITLAELVGNYHRYRLHRIFSGQGQVLDDQGNRNLETFYGAIGVSFLVLPA